MIPLTLEPAVRKILYGLQPGETLTTNALAQQVADCLPPGEQSSLSGHLVKLANNVTDLCTRKEERATSGYMKGKMIRRCIWHRIESPDMPAATVTLAHMREGDTGAIGAASPGTSLADRVQALEDWRAQLDARFNPLSTVL